MEQNKRKSEEVDEMIKVTYKKRSSNIFPSKSETFDGDSFTIAHSIPFTRSGIYIYKNKELIVYIESTYEVEKVEKIIFRNTGEEETSGESLGNTNDSIH